MRSITKHYVTVNDVDCEIQFGAVHGSEITAQIGDKFVVAYLVYDDERYVEDLMGDCMGKLYSFERWSRNKDKGLEALGNTSDGEPDLRAVWDNHRDEVVKRSVGRLLAVCDLEVMCEGLLANFDQDEAESNIDFVKASLASELTEYDDWTYLAAWQGDIVEEILTEMWSEPEFFPGDPDAQVLACYDHSGQHWSLSGQGMQCRWDTSNKAGVWVPGDYLRKELDAAAPVAARALVRRSNWLRGSNKAYQLVVPTWADDKVLRLEHVEFSDDAGALHAKAREIAASLGKPSAKQLAWGRNEMSEVYAQQFLDTYNDIINGQVYGCVVETFDIDGERESEEAVWGLVGDYAEEHLKSELFDPACACIKVGGLS